MPVAAGVRVQVLADAVRFIEKVVQQPKPARHASAISISNRTGHDVRRFELRQTGSHRFVGRAGIERHDENRASAKGRELPTDIDRLAAPIRTLPLEYGFYPNSLPRRREQTVSSGNAGSAEVSRRPAATGRRTGWYIERLGFCLPPAA